MVTGLDWSRAWNRTPWRDRSVSEEAPALREPAGNCWPRSLATLFGLRGFRRRCRLGFARLRRDRAPNARHQGREHGRQPVPAGDEPGPRDEAAVAGTPAPDREGGAAEADDGQGPHPAG